MNKDRKCSSRWIRPHLDTPATVLLLSSLNELTNNKYEELATATAVTPNQEMSLILTYSPSTWKSMDRINHLTNIDIIDISSVRTATAHNTPEQSSTSAQINSNSRQDATESSLLIGSIKKFIDDYNDVPTTILLDSLTTLLSYTTLSDAYDLITSLSELIDDSEVVIYFCMDPSDHDIETIYELKPLFDATAKLVDDDTWSIKPQ